MEIKPVGNPEQALSTYAINLNLRAELDQLDPVIGREREINRLIQILSRKTKNNPVLIGEPGVGKTAIVEGLAQRIYRNDVPENLANKTIYQLDMGALVAGSKFHGEFESRLKAVLTKVQKSEDQIILFIDELHLIVGAGRTQGSMDASNLLKPMLARGELRCIGATTLDEHREYIEKDRALERRFQRIIVNESSEEDTLSILRGLRERFEAFHGVMIHDSALVAAARLANRYISDRYMPDKAIDLIDEACASIKTQIASVPIELDQINRQVIQLKIEAAALKREDDSSSMERLKVIKQDLKQALAEQSKVKIQWEKESQRIKKIKTLTQEIEQLKQELDKLSMVGNFKRAGEIKYSLLPKQEQALTAAKKAVVHNELIKEDVAANQIAAVVASWTGIPVTRLVESEKQKLLNLPVLLKRRVKGQNHAITALSEAILRSRSGIQPHDKPIGSFLFLGTTGVGKTEVARALAEALFNSEKNMIRLDMSEYKERYAISKLVGSAPGYIGYEKGGNLTEAVRRHPFSIVLFDEIEKAHSDVINLLLQIMDNGQLTDSLGKKVDFRNTIIIMTSNVGSDRLLADESAHSQIKQQLSQNFKPELINRIDNVIIFNTLSQNVIREIIDLELTKLQNRILRVKNINLEFDSTVRDRILEAGYSKEFGARPIKRFIEQQIATIIASALVREQLKPKVRYAVWFENHQFYLDLAAKLN